MERPSSRGGSGVAASRADRPPLDKENTGNAVPSSSSSFSAGKSAKVTSRAAVAASANVASSHTTTGIARTPVRSALGRLEAEAEAAAASSYGEAVESLTAAAGRLFAAGAAAPPAAMAPAARKHVDDDVIEIGDSSDDGGSDDCSVQLVVSENRLPTPPPTKPSPPAAAGPAAANAKLGASDDEIEDLGTTNTVQFPHARHDCPDAANVFVQDGLAMKKSGSSDALMSCLAANRKICGQCYCYVCDCPASECKAWADDAMTAATCHCLASNKGVDGPTWRKLREASRPKASVTVAPAPASASAAPASALQPKKSCSSCGLMGSRDAFSQTQWHRSDGNQRRCKICVTQAMSLPLATNREADERVARQAERDYRSRSPSREDPPPYRDGRWDYRGYQGSYRRSSPRHHRDDRYYDRRSPPRRHRDDRYHYRRSPPRHHRDDRYYDRRSPPRHHRDDRYYDYEYGYDDYDYDHRGGHGGSRHYRYSI